MIYDYSDIYGDVTDRLHNYHKHVEGVEAMVNDKRSAVSIHRQLKIINKCPEKIIEFHFREAWKKDVNVMLPLARCRCKDDIKVLEWLDLLGVEFKEYDLDKLAKAVDKLRELAF